MSEEMRRVGVCGRSSLGKGRTLQNVCADSKHGTTEQIVSTGFLSNL